MSPPSHQLHDLLASARDMMRPPFHQPAALLKEVGASVGSLDRATCHVAERGLSYVVRGIGCLRDPVSQAGSEAMRARG